MQANHPKEAKKRGKYGRPCDRCAARRIRCLTPEGSDECSGCSSSNEKCTRNRVRKKSGPKQGARRNRSVEESSIPLNESSPATEPTKGRSQQVRDEGFSESPAHTPSKRAPGGSANFLDMPQTLPTNSAASPRVRSIPGLFDTQYIGPSLQCQEPQMFMSPQNTPKISPANLGHPQSVLYHHYATQTPWGFPSQYPGHFDSKMFKIHHSSSIGIPSDCNVQEQLGSTSLPQSCAERTPPVSTRKPEDAFSSLKTGPSPYISKLTFDCLLKRVKVYQAWFYGCWPVLSVVDLLQGIRDGSREKSINGHIVLNDDNAMSYALCCALCAAITTQLSFVNPESVPIESSFASAKDYAAEAKRVRDLFDHIDKMSVETLLSSFFLYAHYTNQKGEMKKAKFYLREAITIAQVLGLHERSQYKNLSRDVIHQRRKIYYTLLVTERYVCFEEGLPVILDPCIEFPKIADEQYPDQLRGFTELIQIFSVPNKEFFFEMNQKRHDKPGEERSIDEKRQWILAVQEKLGSVHCTLNDVPNPQKLNILLSRAWIRAIACHITWNNGMLQLSSNAHDCFGFDFPLANAREFLWESSLLPDMAYEANGPGICVKLLEMASSLSFSVQQSSSQFEGLSMIEALFGLVNKFKNDITLPIKVYQDIASFIATHKSRTVPRLIGKHDEGYISSAFESGTIEELLEEEVSQAPDDQRKDEFGEIELSPYSRQISEQGMGMLTSVPSFLNLRYPQIEDIASDQNGT